RSLSRARSLSLSKGRSRSLSLSKGRIRSLSRARSLSLSKGSPQEPLARCADEHAVSECGDVSEPAQNIPVLVSGLRESDSRIDDDARGGDACLSRFADAFAQLCGDLAGGAAVL